MPIKRNLSTSSSSTDNTTTVSIVDGSADGYMKIGNMLMVWGKTKSNPSGDFTYSKAFNETPKIYILVKDAIVLQIQHLLDSVHPVVQIPISYLVIGKWQ